MKRWVIGGILLGGALMGAHPVYADTLGQVVTFKVDVSYDSQNVPTMTATLRSVGTRAYFYIDDRAWNALSESQRTQFTQSLDTLTRQFDDVIYPNSTAFWGSENTPGIDNDPHVTVLIEKLISGAGGYFDSVHSYPVSQASRSNGREMVVIAFESVSGGTGANFLAHEFQHLIAFNQRVLLHNWADETWLNEARSEYTIALAGYDVPYFGSTFQRRVLSFLRTPSDSLTEWANNTNDYANTSLFFHYLAERFGSGPLKYAISSPRVGVSALDEWLVINAQGTRFADVFTDWMLASYINDRSFDVRYGYLASGLSSIHVTPEIQQGLPAGTRVTANLVLKEWQPTWLQFDTSGAMPPQATVTVAGQTTWSGAVVATYQNNARVVTRWTTAMNGSVALSIATSQGGAQLRSLGIVLAQGTDAPSDGRAMTAQSVSVGVSLGGPDAPNTVLGTPPPLPPQVQLTAPHDGDLIRRPGQQEVYVLWGGYRRYLPNGVLALYGFQNRPIAEVADDVFARYSTTNYVRAEGQKKVYALWPDGTKHWLNITAAQWDASGRDWNAIFVVNDAEVNFYGSGPDITR